MENLKKIIESKKLKSSDKKPRYGTRKLSVGLVSCMLGYFVFMSPTVVNAQTVEVESDTTTAVSESVDKPQKAEVNESSEAASVSVDKEVAEKNTEVEERKEATTNVAVENEENTLEKKTEAVANSEEITNKEEAAKVSKIEPNEATENKSSEVADAEEAAKAVEEKEETVSAKENKDEKEVENKDVATKNAGDLEVAAEEKEALGISEEIDPEAQTAEESKDISNNIINPRVSIRTENTTTPKTLDAGLGEQLTWGVSFTTPEGTKAGDTFTVKLSDNMSLKGLEPDTDYALPVKFGDKIIATAKRIDRQTIQYTFTKDIEDLKYARVYIINSAQENKDVVQNSGKQTFKINVGEKAKDEKDINVDFGKLYHAETSENVNGKSQFTEFNPETGEFTQVFYLNPESKVINTSSTNDQNGREWGKVGFLLSSPHDADKPRSVDYLENNTKIEVKKLPKGAKLPDAIIENPEGAQPATKVEGGFRNFKGEPMFTMNFGGGNKIDSPYVVVVKGHANKIDGKYTNLYSNGTLYGDGDASLFLDNTYTVQENSTDSEGKKETLGYFKEHHIYITKEDGTEKSRFEIPGATVSGTADEYYYTDKNEIPGYHFVKVDTDKLVNDPAYNDQGKITKGNYEVSKTKEVTYIYERDIKHGSFQEHHIYQSLDEDGNIVAKETVTKEGKKQQALMKQLMRHLKKDQAGNVVTAEKDKDGYKLVNVKATNDASKDLGVKFDEKGAVTTGNYVNDKKLEVTYTYQKNVITKGSFQEHHIYITKDQDGVETGRKEDDGKLQEGKKDQSYTTGKIEKDGFEFVRTETPVNEPKFDKEGAKTEGNFKPGVKQEITYVYEKTVKDPQKEPGSFIEHHIYITKDQDGVETGRKEDDGKLQEGKKDQSYTTGKIEKDGFEFVRTETPVNEPKFDKEGAKTEGNFKPGVKQEITYVYEKTVKDPQKEPGSFIEHHIYITKDQDGVETGRKEDDGKLQEGKKDQSYTTGKIEKDGFEFVRTETPVNEPKFDKEGAKTEGNFKPGVKQEITYVYEKTVKDPQKEPGSFIEHHIYITKDQDGVETGRKEDDGKLQEGKKDQSYTTGKIEKDGFEFVRTETPVNEPKFDKEGAKTEGNFKPGVKQEITYVYEKTVKDPQKEPGSFIEHHIYITKDQDGVETGRKEDDGKLQEGKKDQSYTTGKIEKDGFEFVRTETPVNEPKFDKEGAKTEGNFKPGVKQEITYVYEKTVKDPQKEPGSFIEHHIYITKDQDGVETGRKEDDGKLQEGKKDQSYTTGKIEKDGFEFVRTETPVNEPKFDKEGAKTEGNFKPGVKQEITYVYEKTVNDPQKEPATPIKGEDPKEDPKKPNEPTPLVPLTPAEPVEPNESTPPRRYHKTPGTPVVTEVPPTKVVEIEKTPEEKSEESKEVENKEEKVEVKEIEKEEAPELVSKEVVKDKGLEAQKKSYEAKDDNKAPKTSDAGILSSIGLSSLAASGLAFLELRKRNKKNK